MPTPKSSITVQGIANVPYVWPMNRDPLFSSIVGDFFSETTDTNVLPSIFSGESGIDFTITFSVPSPGTIDEVILLTPPLTDPLLLVEEIGTTNTFRVRGTAGNVPGEEFRFITFEGISITAATEDQFKGLPQTARLFQWTPPIVTLMEREVNYTFEITATIPDPITGVPTTSTFQIVVRQFAYWSRNESFRRIREWR